MGEGMEFTKENVDKYINSSEVRKYRGDRRIVSCTDIVFTDEDIQRAIQYIKSNENQDKDLQKYKDLSDDELVKVINERIKTEFYNALQRLFKEQNT